MIDQEQLVTKDISQVYKNLINVYKSYIILCKDIQNYIKTIFVLFEKKLYKIGIKL